MMEWQKSFPSIHGGGGRRAAVAVAMVVGC